MKEYILILLAVVCFAAQFAITKLFGRAVEKNMGTTMVMLVVSGAAGAVLYFIINGFQIQFSTVSVFWSFVLALLIIPCHAIGIKVLSMGSLAIYSMFMMLGGMLVPFFYGIVFLGEPLSLGKALGSILLTACVVLQAVWQKEPADTTGKADSRQKYRFFLLCMVIFLCNGLTGVVAKVHGISEGAVDAVSFIVTYCGFISLLSLVILLLSFCRDREKMRQQSKVMFGSKPLLLVVALGIASYTGSFLHVKAAVHIPASLQFPLVSGGVIVLSSLISAVAFKERLPAKEWLSLLGAFVATVLFAF